MEYPRKFFADIDTSYSKQKSFKMGRADLHPVKYEESIGHDQTEIKEDYLMRMTFKFVEGKQTPNIKMQTRQVCYGDTEKAYKFGRGKAYSQDEAWKKLEDCMVNLSMVGKPHPINLPELDANFVELMTIKNGTILSRVRTTEYSEIEETFARRTFDESGDYTVRPFLFEMKLHSSL